ncbi:MAG: hypothetical protein WCT20_02070 [Candidatus Babeliales bacterium]|jgi:hypothetical protein
MFDTVVAGNADELLVGIAPGKVVSAGDGDGLRASSDFCSGSGTEEVGGELFRGLLHMIHEERRLKALSMKDGFGCATCDVELEMFDDAEVASGTLSMLISVIGSASPNNTIYFFIITLFPHFALDVYQNTFH